MLTHLSLFSGSGIGTLAAQAAGIVTVAHAENDPACCYCLERLWPAARLFRDVRDVTAESVEKLGPIDIISGGFPCVDISTAGKGAGLGTEETPTRSGLWYEFARVIREVRPTWLLIENVPALRVRGGDRVTNDLEAMAYEWEAVVVGADDVGAPHRRKRVWIVGKLDNVYRERCRHAGRGRSGNDSKAAGQSEQPETAESSSLADAESVRRTGQATSEGTVRSGRVHKRRPAEDGRFADSSNGSTGTETSSHDVRVRSDMGSGQPRMGSDAMPEVRRNPIGRSDVPLRWPARPGQPQHDWEAPRLVEFGVGSESTGLARRIRERLGGTGNGIPLHKAASAANKAMLRMIGNGWQYQIPLMIFRWIAYQEDGTMRTTMTL